MGFHEACVVGRGGVKIGRGLQYGTKYDPAGRAKNCFARASVC